MRGKKSTRKTRHLRVIGVWIILLPFLFAGAGSGKGTVICFGADGHVAVETASSGSCEGFSNIFNLSRVGSLVSLRGPNCYCGPCLDVFVSAVTPNQRVVTAKSAQKHAPSPGGFARTPYDRAWTGATCAIPPPPSPPVNTALISIRAVVLLI